MPGWRRCKDFRQAGFEIGSPLFANDLHRRLFDGHGAEVLPIGKESEQRFRGHDSRRGEDGPPLGIRDLNVAKFHRREPAERCRADPWCAVKIDERILGYELHESQTGRDPGREENEYREQNKSRGEAARPTTATTNDCVSHDRCLKDSKAANE